MRQDEFRRRPCHKAARAQESPAAGEPATCEHNPPKSNQPRRPWPESWPPTQRQSPPRRKPAKIAADHAPLPPSRPLDKDAKAIAAEKIGEKILSPDRKRSSLAGEVVEGRGSGPSRPVTWSDPPHDNSHPLEAASSLDPTTALTPPKTGPLLRSISIPRLRRPSHRNSPLTTRPNARRPRQWASRGDRRRVPASDRDSPAKC